MSFPITLGAKNLAAFSMPDFCPRCMWLKLKMSFNTPYNIFPSVFSVFDGHTKRRIQAYIEKHGKVPPWMADVGEITGHLLPPSTSAQFAMLDPATNITVRGVPDAILVKPDKTLIIVDFKTAKPENDHLHDLYATQTNCYAMIAPQIKGYGTVSEIKLVYTNPIIEPGEDDGDDSFPVYFKGTVKSVAIDPARVMACLALARKIADMETAPRGREECRDCMKVDEIIALAESMKFDVQEARRIFTKM